MNSSSFRGKEKVAGRVSRLRVRSDSVRRLGDSISRERGRTVDSPQMSSFREKPNDSTGFVDSPVKKEILDFCGQLNARESILRCSIF